MKKTHKFAYKTLRFFGIPFVKWWMGYDFQVARNLPENYIVMSNHTTDVDPVLVAMSFPKPMGFVASEHIARWGTPYKMLISVATVILRKKGTTAATTVREILKSVRGGTNVCIFAEGDKSWDGVTRSILPSTGKMVKNSRCGLVTYRLEGGYFVSPRWSKLKNKRKGHFYGRPVHVYFPEDLAKMSPEEINDAIAGDIFEDAYARQLEAPKEYKGKNLAEGLETVLFICEKCGKIDGFKPDDSKVTCNHCGHQINYTTYGLLEGSEHETIHSYVEWEKQQLKTILVPEGKLVSETGRLVTFESGETVPVAEGKVEISASGLYVNQWHVELENINDMAMFGNRTMVFSTVDGYYELSITDKSSTLKFQMFWDEWSKKIER